MIFPPQMIFWAQYRRVDGILDDRVADQLLTPTFPDRTKPLRYYQEIAVNRAVQAALQGRDAGTTHSLHRGWEDRCRFPDLLEALVGSLERQGRQPQPEDPVSR